MNITINEKPSAQSYLESLANKLSNCFNSVAFKTSCGTELVTSGFIAKVRTLRQSKSLPLRIVA